MGDVAEKLRNATILEKAAEHIEALEKRAGELHAKIGTLQETVDRVKQASAEPVIQDFMSRGFTQEEALDMVSKLPGQTLTKVAGLNRGSADEWSMGSVSEVPGSNLDPITAWILS